MIKNIISKDQKMRKTAIKEHFSSLERYMGKYQRNVENNRDNTMNSSID